MKLRDFQTDCVNTARNTYRAGHKSVLIQAPTGAGKTVIAAEIIRLAAQKGSRVLMLVPSRELNSQAHGKLAEMDVDAGIILSGERPDLSKQVQVGSIQTFSVRAVQRRGHAAISDAALGKFDIIVIDEAHRAIAKTYQEVIAKYPDALVMGLTATPRRLDGRGLGQLFEAMVRTPDIPDLIKLGYLVRPRVIAPSVPDLREIGVSKGDYKLDELAAAMDQPKLVGDIIEHWQEWSSDRKTIVFASSVQHSRHVRDRFEAIGVPVAHIDGETELPLRLEAFRDFESGKVQVLTNFGVCTEGYDCPSIETVVLARPTKSPSLYLQMLGRGLRTSPGKTECLVIDHGGLTFAHGFADDRWNWTLKGGKSTPNETQQQREKRDAKPLECRKCKTVFTRTKICPSCGEVYAVKGKDTEWVDGQLGLIAKDPAEVRRDNARRIHTEQVKKLWYSQLKYYAKEKGYKAAWVSHKFKSKFREWPAKEFRELPSSEPSTEVRGWIRYEQIKYAKSKNRVAA